MKLMSCAILALLACPTVAQAAPVIWNVQNATFADGGTLNGTFTYNAATNIYSNILLSVAGGNASAFVYSSLDQVQIKGNTFFNIFNSTANRFVFLSFATALNDAGGTIQLRTGRDSYENYAAGVARTVISGEVTTQAVAVPTAAVPEPATWAMMIGGFGLVGASMRRRTTRVRFA